MVVAPGSDPAARDTQARFLTTSSGPFKSDSPRHNQQLHRTSKQHLTRGPWQLDTTSPTTTSGNHPLTYDKHDSRRQPLPQPSSPPSSPPTTFYSIESPTSASTSVSSPPRSSFSSLDSPSPSSNGLLLPFTPPDLGPQSQATSLSAFSRSKGMSQRSKPTDGNQTGSHLPTLASPPPAVGLSRSGAIKSRNDIFAPSPVLAPPRPPPSAATMSPSSSADLSRGSAASDHTIDMPASSSRNSLFFTDTTSGSKPPATSSPNGFEVWRGQWQSNQDASTSHASAPSADQEALAYSSDVTRANSYGRSNDEERARERIRIRQSKEIDFRLAPSKEFILGEGRHCTVFLGAYRRRSKHEQVDPHSQASTKEDGKNVGNWQLCAVKRLHADRQSQLLGLDEAFALRRLGTHPGIIHLIDIRDEVLAETSPLPTPNAGPSSFEPSEEPFDRRIKQSEMGRGLPPSMSASASAHGRSTSSWMTMETTRQHDPLPADTPPERSNSLQHSTQRSAHSRIVSQPTNSEMKLMSPPRLTMARPSADGLLEEGETIDADDVPISAAAMHSQNAAHRDAAQRHKDHLGAPPASDPPRLLILLELLPFTLSAYVKRNADAVDMVFWLRTGIAMTETLEFIHSKGCIHSDIKPENILLDKDHHPKLCDFNSAIFLHTSGAREISDGIGLGTPAYAAPELTKRGQGNKLSYAVDIFSLGAVLYSLATGVEPMSRARSMIDMIHRKERWFLSEENDRIARHSVDFGGSNSNAGSTTASRHGSLRGKKSRQSTILPDGLNRPALRRQASSDSVESHVSSITNAEGKTPSWDAIELLLQPSDVVGVMLPPVEQRLRASSIRRAKRDSHNARAGTSQDSEPSSQSYGHHRASSLHKHMESTRSDESRGHATPQNASRPGKNGPGGGVEMADRRSSATATGATSSVHPSNDGSTMLSAPSRPNVLRRTTSYGNSPQPQDDVAPPVPTIGTSDARAPSNTSGHWRGLNHFPTNNNLLSPPQSPNIQRASMPRVRTGSVQSQVGDEENAHVNLALAATFANAARNTSGRTRSRHQRGHSASSLSSCFSQEEDESDGEDGAGDLSMSTRSSKYDTVSMDLSKPYVDGSPPLILPSGSERLPQSGLDLIERMVHAHPHKRPNAGEVKRRLMEIAHELGF